MVWGTQSHFRVRDGSKCCGTAATRPGPALPDILKQPFALDVVPEVVLRAWELRLELKDDQRFGNDLWRFVERATRDPRTFGLDFESPPHFTFPRDTHSAKG
jgi:hypothetical protein